MLMKFTPGVNFTNTFAQSAWHIVFVIKCGIQFDQQNGIQLYEYTQLKVLLNLYTKQSLQYTIA